MLLGQRGTSRVPGGATHTLGDHPIADELRNLRVGGTSLEHTYAPQQRAMLHLPRASAVVVVHGRYR